MNAIGNTLRQMYPIYAQIIAGEIDVKVKIGGHMAYCGLDESRPNARVINLPSLPLDDQEIAKAAFGYLYHEGFHALKSDFKLLTQCAGKPMRKHMLNTIEDIWNEHWMPQNFLASKPYIDAMNEYILAQGWYQVPTLESKPAQILDAYILYWGLGYYNNTPSIKPLADESYKVLAQILSKAGMVKLRALLATDVPKIQSSQDCLALTDKIITLLKEEEEKLNQQAQEQAQADADSQSDSQDSGSSDSSDSGSDAGSSQDGSADGSSDESSDSSPEGDSDSSENGGGNSSSSDDAEDGSESQDSGSGTNSNDSKSNESDSEEGSSDGQDSAGDDATNSPSGEGSDSAGGGDERPNIDPELAAQMVEQMMNAMNDDVPNHHLDQFVDQMAETNEQNRCSSDAYQVGSESETPVRGNTRLANDFYGNAIAHSNAVRQQMARVIESQARQDNTLRDRGSRVDRRRAHGVLTGNYKVFKDSRKSKVKTAAMHLLVDTSGSMNSNDMKCAMEASIAIGSALEKVRGANLGISHFPACGGVYAPIMRHGQRIGDVIDNFGLTSSGGTPMAEAMWGVSMDLLTQKEERKILIVITDGSPNDSSAVANYLKQMGPHVEVIAIGINADYVTSLFQNSTVIRDVSELPNRLLEVIGRALLAA